MASVKHAYVLRSRILLNLQKLLIDATEAQRSETICLLLHR